MNRWLEILGGVLLLLIVVLVCYTDFWQMGTAAWTLLKGGIVWFVGILGLLFVVLGIMDSSN